MHGSISTTTDFNLTISVESGEIFDVRHFDVNERMSSLFEIRLVAVSENPDVDFERIIGRPMAFTTRGRQTRTWTGVCNHLQQIGVEEAGLSTYELTLVPSLWLLTQRRNYRIFQLLSEVEIVQKLLSEWSIAPVLKLTDTYKKRKYRVQYAESDYAFLCRMLEDAGVSFYFETDAEEGHESRLVLDDGLQGNAPRPPIAYREHPTIADFEHVTTMRVGRRIMPGRYTVRDHDYRRPAEYRLVASAAAPEGLESHLERYHYVPGAFLFESDRGDSTPSADARGMYRTDEGEGNALVQRRLDAKRAPARMVSFETNVIDPGPGTVLSFLDHPKSELGPGKTFLVVESNFSGTHSGEWSHACTAVAADVQYRPELRTPKPKVMGVESATVVGPPGDEIHVDEFGRVCVHFHWDRESRMDDNSSCWIHSSQPWGGSGYGGSSLPRIGQEVIVDFLGGDPDRPVIIGRMYTNLQKTPYKLPDNKTQSGWKSNSTGGGGGYNEMMFEDSQGKELLRMQAERDLDKLVKNDERVKIGQDRTKDVGRDDSQDVGRDRARTVGRDESVDIGQDRTRSVGRDESVEVGQDRTRAVGRDESVEVGQDRTRAVGRDENVNVGNDRSRSVGRDEMINIGRDFIQSISQSKDLTIGEDYTKNVGGSERVTAGQNLSLAVGQNRTTEVAMVDRFTVGEEFFVGVKRKPEKKEEKPDLTLSDAMGIVAGENDALGQVLAETQKGIEKADQFFKIIADVAKLVKPNEASDIDQLVGVFEGLYKAGQTGGIGIPAYVLNVVEELAKAGRLGERAKLRASIINVIGEIIDINKPGGDKEGPDKSSDGNKPDTQGPSGGAGRPPANKQPDKTQGGPDKNDPSKGGNNKDERPKIGKPSGTKLGPLATVVKAILDLLGLFKTPEGNGKKSGPPPLSATVKMTDKKIVLDTGAGALITMDGAKVTISAGVIELFAGEILHSVPLKKGAAPKPDEKENGDASSKSPRQPKVPRQPSSNGGADHGGQSPSGGGGGPTSGRQQGGTDGQSQSSGGASGSTPNTEGEGEDQNTSSPMPDDTNEPPIRLAQLQLPGTMSDAGRQIGAAVGAAFTDESQELTEDEEAYCLKLAEYFFPEDGTPTVVNRKVYNFLTKIFADMLQKKTGLDWLPRPTYGIPTPTWLFSEAVKRWWREESTKHKVYEALRNAARGKNHPEYVELQST